jgi:hypothetical protein
MKEPIVKRIDFVSPVGVTEHITLEYDPERGRLCELSISAHRLGEAKATLGRKTLRELMNALSYVEEKMDTFVTREKDERFSEG